LANFASKSPHEIPIDIKIFDVFYDNIGNVVKAQASNNTHLPLENILALEVSLLNLSLRVYPKEFGYVDKVLAFCADILKQHNAKDFNKNTIKEVFRLLHIPLNTYKNVLTVLKLDNYHKVILALGYADRKKIALDIVQNAIDNDTKIPESNQVDKILTLISPLIKDEEGQTGDEAEEDFEEEQNLVARLVHLFENSNLELLYGTYLKAKAHFDLGGKRKKFTLVPLVFACLRLAGRLANTRDTDEGWIKKARQVLRFSNQVVTALKEAKNSVLALKLYLQCALAAGKCAFDNFAFEFLTQAFTLYEEDIAESKDKFSAICQIVGVLHQVRCIEQEQYNNLVKQTLQHAGQFLKIPDKCRGTYFCCHSVWAETRDPLQKSIKDGKLVAEWLKKAIRVADAAGTGVSEPINAIPLFVEVLDQYLYFFQVVSEEVTANHINTVIEVIKKKLEEGGNNAENTAASLHFKNTLKYIEFKQKTDNKYAAITT